MKLPNFSTYLPASPAGGPNKKFIFACLIGLIIVTAGFLIFTSAKKQETAKQEPQINKPAISQEITKDSDNDGLPDWKETLWGTDPNNPDTDKDGVPDGQEIKENRNPLLAGNGKTDKIESPKPEKSPAEQAIQPPSTLTEALAQNLFSDFLFAKEIANETGNNKISESDQTTIASSFWDILGNFKETEREVYDKTDIKISSSDDVASVKNYGNGLALIIKKYFDPLPENEMEIFKTAMTNQDAEGLKKIESVADAYRNAAKNALSLEVPPSYAVEHLYLVNIFNDIGQDLNLMQKAFDDPARTLLALDRFKKEAIIARFILRDLNTYFNEKKVTFGNGEPAEFFKIYLN